MRSLRAALAIAFVSLACGGKSSSPPAPEAPAPAPAAIKEAPAVHGMLVFGQSATFVSHLPMFGAPHDYQILAEVKLLKDKSFNQDLFAAPNPHGYHTIKPEPFSLPDANKLGFRFPATLYAGHFEREGHTELGNVVIEIKRVIHFRKLTGPKEDRPVYKGIVFGDVDSSEYYLAHHIDGPPSFDQISLIGAGAPTMNREWANGLDATASVHPDQPLPRYSEFQLHVQDAPVRLKTRAVYTETEELKK